MLGFVLRMGLWYHRYICSSHLYVCVSHDCFIEGYYATGITSIFILFWIYIENKLKNRHFFNSFLLHYSLRLIDVYSADYPSFDVLELADNKREITIINEWMSYEYDLIYFEMDIPSAEVDVSAFWRYMWQIVIEEVKPDRPALQIQWKVRQDSKLWTFTCVRVREVFYRLKLCTSYDLSFHYRSACRS